jgi:hypothetical protein
LIIRQPSHTPFLRPNPSTRHCLPSQPAPRPVNSKRWSPTSGNGQTGPVVVVVAVAARAAARAAARFDAAAVSARAASSVSSSSAPPAPSEPKPQFSLCHSFQCFFWHPRSQYIICLHPWHVNRAPDVPQLPQPPCTAGRFFDFCDIDSGIYHFQIDDPREWNQASITGMISYHHHHSTFQSICYFLLTFFLVPLPCPAQGSPSLPISRDTPPGRGKGWLGHTVATNQRELMGNGNVVCFYLRYYRAAVQTRARRMPAAHTHGMVCRRSSQQPPR